VLGCVTGPTEVEGILAGWGRMRVCGRRIGGSCLRRSDVKFDGLADQPGRAVQMLVCVRRGDVSVRTVPTRPTMITVTVRRMPRFTIWGDRMMNHNSCRTRSLSVLLRESLYGAPVNPWFVEGIVQLPPMPHRRSMM